MNLKPSETRCEKFSRRERAFLGAVALALLVVLAGGGWFFYAQECQVRQEAAANLESVAKMKVEQIVEWRKERWDDAAELAESSLFSQNFRILMADKNSDFSPLLGRLQALQRHKGYCDVLIVDAAGQVRLGISHTNTARTLFADELGALREAFRTRTPQLTDLELRPGLPAPQMSVMAPMFDQPESGAAPIGAVLLQIDATKFLNRVTEWPVVTETAETMLVRRQGEDVVFLNELRFQTGAVLNFRIPMTRTNVPSVMAVLGWQGVVEGTDYRGHAVLAALRPVPDSPWHIAAKTDTAQALADWRSRRELILALLVLMVSGLGTAAWVATQQRNRVVALTRLTEALREREARLADVAGLNEKLLGAATLGIQVFDAAGACVLTNAAAAQTVGGTVEQLRAQNFRQIASWQKSGMLAAAEQALASGQTQRKEISLVSTFQRELVLDCTFSRFESGGQPHLLLVLADITERKQLEAKQQSLVEELRRSNADLEQFAYVASHDLKAPLRAIDSLAGWLEEDLGPALKDENRKHLSLLRQRTKRMERLLEDLLAYSRAGRVAADVAPVAIPHLVAEIAELLNPPAGFSVQLLPAGTAPAGFATAVTPLRQVLYNLVANAVKHHDRKQGAIEVGVASKGDLVEFTVADDGPGIAPEFHRRIFGMFQTLRPRDEVEGSGMGLAMVERIVTRYGGQVTVECRQPHGSIFRFTWPQTIKEPPHHDFAHD